MWYGGVSSESPPCDPAAWTLHYFHQHSQGHAVTQLWKTKPDLFVIDDKQHLQINGTAIGRKMAPTYANELMHYVEETFFSSFDLQPTASFRYIDDIFIIWPHGTDNLETFIEDANRTHRNVSLTHEYSTTAVSFLEVIIKINNGITSTSS